MFNERKSLKIKKKNDNKELEYREIELRQRSKQIIKIYKKQKFVHKNLEHLFNAI